MNYLRNLDIQMKHRDLVYTVPPHIRTDRMYNAA